LKILQVAPRTIPAIGGVELVTAMISKKLVEMGHEVTLVVLNSLDQRDCGFGITYQKPFLITKPIGPLLPPEEYWNGVRILRFPSKAQLLSYYWSPGMLSWLIKNIKYFDIAHTHCLRFSNNEFTAIAHLLNKRRIPLVITCHDVVQRISENSRSWSSIIDGFYIRTIGRILLNLFSRFIALTHTNAIDHIKYLSIDPKKIKIIPNGIELEKYNDLPIPTDLREKLGSPETVILFIGRFVNHKNPDKLILAFKNITKRYGHIHLVMIGKDYGMLNYCKSLVSPLNNQITFYENASEDTKLKALALADICVIPSSNEGFGIVALEAQASGVPVIAAKRGGLRDILVHGLTGLHINPSPYEIHKAISFLLDRSVLRRNMGNEGKKFVQKFSWINTSRKLEAVYREILEERNIG